MLRSNDRGKNQTDGDLKKALKLFEMNPSKLKYVNNVATLFLRRKLYAQALAYGQKSLQISNKKNPVISVVATALLGLGKRHEALRIAKLGLIDFPNDKVLLDLAVNISFKDNFPLITVKMLNKLKRQTGKLTAKQLNMKAISHLKLGEIKKAQKHATTATNFFPNYAPVYNTLGRIMQWQGNTLDALEHFAKCVEMEPESVDAVYNFVMAKRFVVEDKALIDNISSRYANEEEPVKKTTLGYSLAKICDDLNQYNAAANFLIASGRIRHKALDYTKDKISIEFGLVDSLPLDKKNFELSAIPGSNKRPIFIVGMPRSGTSLLEQMVSNHSQVTGLGELPYIRNEVSQFLRKPSDQFELFCNSLRKNYFSTISNLAVTSEVFTDKMPSNFLYISAIINAFPEAKILHIKRQAEATCFSCFKKFFNADGLGWTFDQASIVLYYHFYLKHMQKIENSFKGKLFTIHYEDLVADPTTEIKKVLDYCDLTFEDSAVKPETNTRGVLTASMDQINKKIFNNSGEAWKKYEKHLPDLFSGLRGLKSLSTDLAR